MSYISQATAVRIKLSSTVAGSAEWRKLNDELCRLIRKSR